MDVIDGSPLREKVFGKSYSVGNSLRESIFREDLILYNCLQILTFGDAEAKLAVWNSKGPRDVVNIVHRNRDEKLQWTASRLLRGKLYSS